MNGMKVRSGFTSTSSLESKLAPPSHECGCRAHSEIGPMVNSEPEDSKQGNLGRFSSASSPVILSLLVAFLPKCALCWGAYLALFNSLGICAFQYPAWLKEAFAITLVASLILFYRAAMRSKTWAFFWMQLGGISCVLISQYVIASVILSVAGIVLLSVGTYLTTRGRQATLGLIPLNHRGFAR